MSVKPKIIIKTVGNDKKTYLYENSFYKIRYDPEVLNSKLPPDGETNNDFLIWDNTQKKWIVRTLTETKTILGI